MAIGDIIVGVDIGTSKVCTVVGEVNNFGQIEIIANTSYKCSGLKKGKIINEEEVILSLAKTIKDAEDETNLKINSAYVTIPGKYVTIVQNSITKDVKDKYSGISIRDVQTAIMQVKDIEIPEGETLIDIVPDKITLENGTVVSDPVGNLSSSFTISAQVILAERDYVRQLNNIFRKVGLEIDGIVPITLAERNLILDKNEDVLFCINTAKKLKLHVHLYTSKEVITEKLLYMDLRNFELTKNDKNIDLEFKIVTDIQEYIERENPEILKLVISAEKDLASLKKEFAKNKNLQVNLIRKIDKYRDEIIGKEYEYLDVMPAGINKEQALEVLENYLKIDKSEVLAIGDNLNDLEMIKDSGVGIAVANAYDEVKEVANYTTTTTAQNGGFAEAVYKFIEFK